MCIVAIIHAYILHNKWKVCNNINEWVDIKLYIIIIQNVLVCYVQRAAFLFISLLRLALPSWFGYFMLSRWHSPS